jgi:hypothetical protein
MTAIGCKSMFVMDVFGSTRSQEPTGRNPIRSLSRLLPLTSFVNSFAAPPVLRMHYSLRLRSMLLASAYALYAHTSDGEASCYG